MVYKKYIEKNGKIYGPYIYHSKRVNGKVVSEYKGVEKESKNFRKNFKNFESRKNFVFAGGILILIILGIWLFLPSFNMSGNAILSLQNPVIGNNLISGNISFSFFQGELIPAKTIITIENGGKSHQYFLNDLINETQTQGNFYLEGTQLVGEGSGYGLIGQQEQDLPIFFQFKLKDKNNNSGGVTSSGGGAISNTTSIVPNIAGNKNREGNLSFNNSSNKNTSNLNSSNSQNISNSNSLNNKNNTFNKNGQTNKIEKNQTKTQVNTVSNKEINNINKTNAKTTTKNEKKTTKNLPISKPQSFTSSKNETISTQKQTSAITGNVIGNMKNFLVGSFTGRAIDNNLVQGSIKKGGRFQYNLPSGKEAEIIPSSIRTEEGGLNGTILKVFQENGKFIVTTNYSKINRGFGKNYINKKKKIFLSIPLSKLKMSFEQGPIIIKGTYGDLNLFSINGKISNETSGIIKNITGEVNTTGNSANNSKVNNSVELGNVTGNLSFENKTLNLNETINKTNETLKLFLTEKEKNILKNALGMIIVETSAERYRNKIFVKFKLGDYTLGHYYNANMTKSELSDAIAKDRIIWLKDLANEFSSKRDNYLPIPNSTKIYPIL